jgi:hypothetical protein
MTLVKVHTAKCTECDKRNKDTMLRCPGCTFQICKPCRDKRQKKIRGLEHGGMLSPGGLGLGNGLGTIRRKVPGRTPGTPPSPSFKDEDEGLYEIVVDKEEEEGEEQEVGIGVKGKGKEKAPAKPTSKKRLARSKPKMAVTEDSSDDDFMLDPASPISHKRRRTTFTITDTPTATSARPSRNAPLLATTLAYVASLSPGPCSDSSAEVMASINWRPTTLNAQELKAAWNVDVFPPIQPIGRIQELLEENGVNTPNNRYEQHFLSRSEPVVMNCVSNVPGIVKRMADRKPRMSAVEKVEARNRAAHVSVTPHGNNGA